MASEDEQPAESFFTNGVAHERETPMNIPQNGLRKIFRCIKSSILQRTVPAPAP